MRLILGNILRLNIMSPEISHTQMVDAERGGFFHVSLYAMILSIIKISFRSRPLHDTHIWASLRNGDKYCGAM